MKVIILFFSLVMVLFADAKLSDSELKVLHSQGYFVKQNREQKSGLIVFDLDKGIKTLMQEITDFTQYPEKIDDIGKIDIYANDSKVIKARIFIESFFIDFDNYVVHEIDEEKHTMKWHLDETKENYFAQMNGYWKFKKVGNKTRIYYYNQLKFKQWVPKFIESYLLEKGLFKATNWVREE